MQILPIEVSIKLGLRTSAIFDEIAQLEKEFFPKYPYSAAEIEKAHAKSDGKSMIAMDDGKVIGYLVPLFFDDKQYTQILTVAVHKEYRRKGYAQKLVEHFERCAWEKGIKTIFVRAALSYPIICLFLKMKYLPLDKTAMDAFISEGLLSREDRQHELRDVCWDKDILSVLGNVKAVEKDTKKENPFCFIPMVKEL